ncbi:MAG: nitrate- and nitrite sensing domain-containing protein [Magnetococcus sp. YQC-5]
MSGRMFSIGNFGIKSKLTLMLLPPILSLFYFILLDYQNIRSQIQSLERLINLANLSVQIGETVHVVQKERGRTTLFLAAQGRHFEQELKAARELTDQKIAPLRDALQQILLKQGSRDMEKIVQQAMTHTEQLKTTRLAVDGLTLNATVALHFYTDLDTNLIHLLDDASLNEQHNELWSHLQAYITLMRSKDLLGLERAQTGEVLQLKELPRDKLMKLVQLNTRQKDHIDRFLHLGGKEKHTLFSQKMDSECVMEVERIQTHLFNDNNINEIKIDPTRWFDLMTCKIDRFKEVENQLVTEIKTQVQTELRANQQKFFIFISLNTTSVVVTFLLVLLIARHLTGHTRRLVQTMRTFSEGMLHARLPVIFHDELGQIAASFNEMATRIEQNVMQESAIAEQERQESERFRQRVQLLRDALIKVASGDLTIRTPEEGADELANLSSNVNIMITSLATMAAHTEEAIHSLSTALKQVQEAAQAHSSGASQQAAAVNETTTTLEEIRAVAAQTLEKAQAMGRIAEIARGEGEKGHQAAKQTLLSMDSIRGKVGAIATTILALSEKTSRIGEITMAVNNLAQQSKMLALNASIEAAKAGEAGKGFAVVADEVKNLAEQSQQFTIQVQRILEEIRHATDKAVMATEEGSKEVDLGAALTEQAGEVVRNLLELLKEAAISGQQIVAAVRQEAAGIDQIGAAMNEINQVTTQSVVSTRQTVQATENLSKLSARLQENNRFYKV